MGRPINSFHLSLHSLSEIPLVDFESERVKLPSTDLSVLQGVNLSSNLKVKPPVPPRLGTDPLKRRFGTNGEFLDTSEPVYAHFVRYDSRSKSARLVRTEK